MVASPKKHPTLALIDELLAEQSRLQTPAARFANAHDSGSLAQLTTARAQLIPLSSPQPGEQYAFEVDLDSCTGCKACVSACHALNGLDDTETWRDVGQLVSPDRRHPFTQTVTTACHHCADPACLNGCPVLAYEKDSVTGIVRHLDDQCIGCSYCVLKCPYDVPKFNERLGIVRKCDMCHSRLAEGEAPACVQACPTQAIRIVTVTTHVNGERVLDTAAFLPAAPDPAYTQPTTRYVSKRALPSDLAAADASKLRPQAPHWPLVVMLTLMPMAVGAFAVAATGVTLPLPWSIGREVNSIALLGWLAGAAGLAASVFHLGQPMRAWRIFLGWRKSWLSREAMIFGVWFPLATAALVDSRFTLAAASVGLVGLFCSVMIYVDTRRGFWRFAQTGPRFFGAALVLGVAVALAVRADAHALSWVLAAGMLVKLAVEARVMRPLDEEDESPTSGRQTARLLASKHLRSVAGLRIAAGLLGGVALPVAIAVGVVPVATAWLVLAVVLAGELAERYLFFRAVDAPKMPGVSA